MDLFRAKEFRKREVEGQARFRPLVLIEVILQQRVLDPAPDAVGQARIFGALVKFSGQWAKAFVVSSDE